ncbi:MAG: isoamylase early set domain-containing protein [Salinibacter sp.]
MSSLEPDTTVRRFIDGDLSDDEVPEALHRIAEDPDARSLLQFELRMTQNLAASGSPQPSSEFASATVEQLEEEQASVPSFRTRLRNWWRTVTRPLITIPVRPAHAMVILLLAGAWWTWPGPSSEPVPVASSPSTSPPSVQTTPASTPQQSQTVWTRFVYTADNAESVAVAGDFSQWRPIPLSPRTVNGKTVWTGLVPVSRGEHEYQFVINGEKWVTDPLAPVTESDGFGAKNAVLKL